MQPVEDVLAFAPEDEATWQRLARGYRLAGLLVSAHRLGLLRILLERGDVEASELASELIADRRLVELMCRALLGAGLLERADEKRLRLSSTGVELAENRAAAVELDVMAADYLLWGQLDERARRLAVGEPIEPDPFDDVARLDTDPYAARRHALRLSARHRDEIRRLVDALEPTRPLRVLDVGGGNGQLAREVCARWPDATCTVAELPAMAQVAEQACGGHDRITVIGGRFFSEADTRSHDNKPLPGRADVVFLSHVLDGLSQRQQRQLALRTAKILAPGGCLVSSESVLLYDERGSLDVLLSMLGQAAAHHNGHVLTAHEQDTLLRAAGLAAADEWWVAESTRAVLGVHVTAGTEPAVTLRRQPT